MTTPATPAVPAAPVPATASPAAPRPAVAPAPTLTDALRAAVVAIARHVTGSPEGSESKALTALGLTDRHAELITTGK